MTKVLRDLLTLTIAFSPYGVPPLTGGNCSGSSLDGVSGSSQIVLRYVGNAGCLSGGIRGEAGGALEWTRSTHGVSSDCTGSHHGGFTAGPASRCFDRRTRTGVARIRLLEQLQDMLGAISSPESQELMIVGGEESTASDGHQPGIADRRKDHLTALSFPITIRVCKKLTRVGWCFGAWT